jgi:hypothetical protein
MYINNCVHMMFKIWYMTMILYFSLLCAVDMMQGFVYEKCCRDTIISIRTEVFS